MKHLDLGDLFLRVPLLAVFVRGSDKGLEQRMRLERLRLELRMELASDEVLMIGQFHHFYVSPIRSRPGNAQSRRDHRLFVLAIELIAVPMPLADFEDAVDSCCQGIRLDLASPGSQTHGAAQF